MCSRIIVPLVSGDGLVMPQVFACCCVQGDDGVGEQVVQLFRVPVIRVPGKCAVSSYVQTIQFTIECHGIPG